MMGNFFPPVIFQVEAIAGEAMASFGAINKQLKVMEAQALKTGKALTTVNKAAIVGTKVLKGLGVAVAAFAAIGVKEVMEVEKSYTRLGQAMAAVGVASDANRKSVAKLVDSYEELGFGGEKAADAYSVLITATGNVEKSNKLLAVSADLARYKQISLDEAARVLAKATQGSVRAFKELGISLDTSKSKSAGIEEAMDKLAKKVGGQATAYTKTFAGQLAILNENLGDLAEAVGMRVLPFLNRLVSGLNNTGTWIKKNQELVIALGAAITIALIPAVVSLTKKLGLLALAILRSPIARVAAVVFAIAYAFVKAYNASEDFRKKVGAVGKWVLGVVQNIVAGYEALERGIMLVTQAGMKMRLEWAKFRKDKEGEAEAKKDLANWEKQYAAIGKYTKAIEEAKRKIDDFTGKKLEIKWDFKIPTIPGFTNGGGLGDVIADDIAKGLDKAKQRFDDFGRDIADKWKKITGTFQNIISKDFETLIQQRIGDPIDQLIYDAQASIDRYQAASGAWTAATVALTKAQDAYVASLKTGDDAIMAAAESALGYAENAVGGLADEMNAALEELAKLQDDMINAVADMYEQISQLESDRTKVLKEAQKERIELEKDYNQEVARIRKDYDQSVIAAEASAASRRAEIIKQSVDQMRSAFRSATYKTLGSVYESLTFEGRYLKGGSIEKILKTLGLQTDKAKTLADNAAKLAGMGFSQTFIEEVIALGPDLGNNLAATILNSTPQSVAQLKTYWDELERVSLHGVDGIAGALNSGMKLATEELTAALLQVDVDLKTELAIAQQNLTDSLKEAFNNYSAALDEINNRTTEQIGAIDAQIAQLNAKIAMMKAALSTMSGLTTPGTGGSTTIIPRAETSEEEGPAGSCASGKGIYKVITYQGTVMSRTLVRCVPKTTTDSTDEEKAAADAANAAANAAAEDADAALAESLDALNATNLNLLKAGGTSTQSINSLVNDLVKGTVSASQIANAMASGLGADGKISAGDASSARYTGQAIDWYYKSQGISPITVNITANTNATSQDIANDVGWSIRTSSDVQYRVPRGAAKPD